MSRTANRRSLEFASFVAALLACTVATAAPITPGNLVLTRAAGGPNGDLSAALLGSGTAAQVFLDEYTTAGVFVQTIVVNSTASATVGSQRALTFSGTQNLEGHITLSGDGQYMTFAGYNQTATVAGTNSNPSGGDTATNAVERVIGRLDLSTGSVDSSTALIDAVSRQSVRTVYSTNGSDFWISGNGGNAETINAASVATTGVHYAQFGVNTGGTTLSTQLNPTGLNANSRYVLAFDGNLYVSSGNTSNPLATNRGINLMTGGIATTTGQTLSNLPGFLTATSSAPDDFWFYDTSTVYLANAATDATLGGIQKWVNVAGTWTHQYTLGAGQLMTTAATPGPAGAHGLTGLVNSQGEAVLFATTFDGAGANANQFFTVTDTGAGSLVSILGTSAANSAFRGIEIAMLPPIPEPNSVVLSAIGVLALAARCRRRSVGDAPVASGVHLGSI